MSVWKRSATAEQLNEFANNTLVSHLQIRVTEIGEDFLVATMPVESFTRQPMGFLHGGASVVLAETLGSIAGHLASEEGCLSFGVEINASHLRSVQQGLVSAIARPFRIGSNLQVWDIQISNDQDELICVSRLTLAIKSPRPA